MSEPIKYLYTIRSANGVIVKNLQVYGKTQEDADKKIMQMYRFCEILSCEPLSTYKTTNPNYEDILNSIIRSDE